MFPGPPRQGRRVARRARRQRPRCEASGTPAGQIREGPEAWQRKTSVTAARIGAQPGDALFVEHVDCVEERVRAGSSQRGVTLAWSARQMTAQKHQRNLAPLLLKRIRTAERLPHSLRAK